MRPLLTGDTDEIREAALSYWGPAVSVRTKTHRLIARTNKGEPSAVELYDMREGPDPVHNVADKEPEVTERLLKHIP